MRARAGEIEMKSPVRGGQSSSDGEAGAEPAGSTVVELDGNRKPSFNAELSSVSFLCFQRLYSYRMSSRQH